MRDPGDASVEAIEDLAKLCDLTLDVMEERDAALREIQELKEFLNAKKAHNHTVKIVRRAIAG